MSDWRGIPREEIPWFPTIDAEKCIGCRECITICKNGVLAFDEVAQKFTVVNPYNCVVECRTCARLCPADAISFPDANKFNDFIKEKLTNKEKS
jgi:NAD-dependent dihydropyrimidine dehydrogenase PreA subunit